MPALAKLLLVNAAIHNFVQSSAHPEKKIGGKNSTGPKAVVVLVERSAQVLSQYKTCAALLKLSEGS